jgi:hypothetical protein
VEISNRKTLTPFMRARPLGKDYIKCSSKSDKNARETGTTATEIADLHFFLGDVDEGFEWLERAYSKREGGLLLIQRRWFLDGVRTDPRYLDLLKRLGLG